MKFLIVLFVFMLHACGMQGDLYLPADNEPKKIEPAKSELEKSAPEKNVSEERSKTGDVVRDVIKDS